MEILNKDKLEYLFKQQEDLQEFLGNRFSDIRDNPIDWQKYMNMMALAMIDETCEMLRETAYKNPNYIRFGWKTRQMINWSKMQGEIIDMWHFMINLSLAAGFDADSIIQGYNSKHEQNKNRKMKDY